MYFHKIPRVSWAIFHKIPIVLESNFHKIPASWIVFLQQKKPRPGLGRGLGYQD